ncbi:MAG: sugar ABC transporter (sugar-binding protein) [Pelagibacterium sp. SCN 64-44]|nr:MAG: sugar ABC transporter (sugar-binding protein) [Pelagibacterium sp. SCN 64-44]
MLAGLASISVSSAQDAMHEHEFNWGKFELAPRIVDKLSKGEGVNIVLGVAGTGIPIQGPAMRIGMDRACEAAPAEIKAECRNVGPVNPNPAQQLSELETLLNSGQVDCLALQPPLPSQFNNIVNRYADAGIPVFTFNIDTPDAKRFAHYALDEETAGSVNGRITANLLKEKGIETPKVAMGSGAPDQPWAQARMRGFEQGFKEVFPQAEFFNSWQGGLPTGKNFTTQEVLNTVTPFLTANSDITLFFHTDQGVEGVGNVIRNLGLQDKVYTSGFNVSGPILDSIDAGATLLTIDQGFDYQGENSVAACATYLATGEVPSDPLQYLNPVVITKAGGPDQIDIAAARERLSSVQ